MEERIQQAERALLLIYIEALGGGHSVVTRFKAFGLNSQRARQFRLMINATKEEAAVAAKLAAAQSQSEIQVKPSAPLVPGQGPKKETAPTLPNKSQPQPQQGQGESVEVVAAGRISDIHVDIERGVSNTQMAAKYDKKELIECAMIDGVTILADWTEKQIIAAIKNHSLKV